MFCWELLVCPFVLTNDTLISTRFFHYNSVKQNVSTPGGIRTAVTPLFSHRLVTIANLKFFAQRIVIYCIYTLLSNKMHIFQINILIFNL